MAQLASASAGPRYCSFLFDSPRNTFLKGRVSEGTENLKTIFPTCDDCFSKSLQGHWNSRREEGHTFTLHRSPASPTWHPPPTPPPQGDKFLLSPCHTLQEPPGGRSYECAECQFWTRHLRITSHGFIHQQTSISFNQVSKCTHAIHHLWLSLVVGVLWDLPSLRRHVHHNLGVANSPESLPKNTIPCGQPCLLARDSWKQDIIG